MQKGLQMSARGKVSELAMRRVLNYRAQCKDKPGPVFLKNKLILQKIDGHDDDGSWEWTVWQSNRIDELGWDKWYKKTLGPYGKQ